MHWRADEEKPDLLIDMGTLTGAARVALGPELPPTTPTTRRSPPRLRNARRAENDPLWRLPLWMRYDQNIDSKIADVNNVATGGMAGSIICALFLKRFVSAARSWLHFDIYAWTPVAKPDARRARMPGGTRGLCAACQALRSLSNVHRHQGQSPAHHHDRRAAAPSLVHREPARHAAVAGVLATGLPRAHFDCLACHFAAQHRAGIDIFVDGDARLDDDVAGRSWVSYATERIEGIGAPRVEVPPAGFMADKGPGDLMWR